MVWTAGTLHASRSLKCPQPGAGRPWGGAGLHGGCRWLNLNEVNSTVLVALARVQVLDSHLCLQMLMSQPHRTIPTISTQNSLKRGGCGPDPGELGALSNGS